MAEVSNWVWDYNVDLLLSHVARVVDYSFDELDRGAVQAGLASSDSDGNAWFDYPLLGQLLHVTVYLARNVGASPITARIVGDMDDVMAARIETIFAVLHDVRPRYAD